MPTNIATGTFTGTGASINVSLGFSPAYVKVFNYNDAGSLYPTLEWFSGMPAASGFKTLKSVDSGSTGNASSNRITSLGISPFAGGSAAVDKAGGAVAATAASRGFTLGADTDVNVSGEAVYFLALENGPGNV